MLFLVLFFVVATGYLPRILQQFYFSNTLLPIADTNFSMQLVEIIQSTGYLFPPEGSFRGLTYSYYPISFVFGAVFTQVTGLTTDFFAFFIYPLVNYLTILATAYIAIRCLVKSKIGTYTAFCVFALNAQLLFFYSFQVFHYEQIAWSYLLLTIYAIVKSGNDRSHIFVILVSMCSFLCAASHHFTSYILLVCLASSLFLSQYIAIHKKIFGAKILPKEKLNRITWISLLAATIVLATKSFLTFSREGVILSQVLKEIFEALLGLRTIGTAKFEPWNYNMFELYSIIIGNIALLIVTIFAFLFSLKQQRLSNRLIEVIAIGVGASLFVLFQYSQFRGTVVIRFFMPYTLVASLLIGNYLGHFTKSGKYRKTVLIIIALTLATFFLAQLSYVKHDFGKEPIILTQYVKASMNFILNEGRVKDDIVACPLGYFERLYSKLDLSPKFHTERTVITAIAIDNGKLLANADYLILYSPLTSEFISNVIEPDLRDEWINSVRNLYFTANKLYDNGKVIVFSGA
jgi:hypothetical protein